MTRPQRRIQKIQSLRQRIASRQRNHRQSAGLQRELVHLVAQQLRSEMRAR